MRKFPPLAADHPIVTTGRLCPGCSKMFVPGDEIGLLLVGPGDDPDERMRRDEGRAYNAIGLPVHWECATQDAGE